MNPKVDCTEAVAALLGVVESGGTITDEQREHLRSCERCRELLDSAKQFQSVLSEETAPPEVTANAAALEREVATSRARQLMTRTIGVIVVLGIFALLMLIPNAGRFQLAPTEVVFLTLMGIFIAILVAAPILLLFQAARSVTQKKDGRRIYRRLGPGRQISGVCLGLSEGLGISLGVLRLLFVIAFFFKGFGLLAYVIFILAMPVHPDDRQHMLRFQLKRMFGGN